MMQLDYLQNLPGALYVQRYTEVETNNCILDERRKEQFPTSVFFSLQSGVPADWLVIR
jgi:hypothetical protein